MERQKITRALIFGLIAGIASTLVTDAVSLLIFLAMGQSLPEFFALIGRSLLTLFKVDAAFPLWQGLVLHYTIGILTGLALGAATAMIGKLRFNTIGKSILFGVVVTEIEGTFLFYLMSLILNIPQADMVLMYSLGGFLHVIWGTCLGLILYYSRKKDAPILEYFSTFAKDLRKESSISE